MPRREIAASGDLPKTMKGLRPVALEPSMKFIKRVDIEDCVHVLHRAQALLIAAKYQKAPDISEPANCKLI
jgi:hypothetical protein